MSKADKLLKRYQEIMEVLEEDPRITLTEMAKRLELKISTCHESIKELKRSHNLVGVWVSKAETTPDAQNGTKYRCYACNKGIEKAHLFVASNSKRYPVCKEHKGMSTKALDWMIMCNKPYLWDKQNESKEDKENENESTTKEAYR